MFANLNLRQRILLGYLVPLLLLGGAMVVVFINLREAEEVSRRLEQARQAEEGAYGVALDIAALQRAARGYMLLKNSISRRTYDEHEKSLADRASLPGLVQDVPQLDALRRVLELAGEIRERTREQMDLVDAGKADDAIAQFRTGVTVKKAYELEQLTNRFLQRAAEQRQEQLANQQAALAAVRYAVIFGGLGAVVIALAIGWWLASALSRKITDNAVQLASAASQIAATVTEQERTASQQAVATNETSATIEELAASSRQSADQAANVAGLAEDATRSTGAGSATSRQTVAAMGALKDKINLMADHILRLSEQSGQIGSIAGLVKDLAGDINMLALNAAVEASRAGEHGKGFAVVASEVRKLADQSKKSAEQTTALIAEIQKATQSSIMMTDDSSRMVADATRQAEEVGTLFEQLAGMVANVTMNAQQVMLNAKQQAAAFGQVAEATTSINAGAKETAAGIGQTKLAVEQLNQAAQNLKSMS